MGQIKTKAVKWRHALRLSVKKCYKTEWNGTGGWGYWVADAVIMFR